MQPHIILQKVLFIWKKYFYMLYERTEEVNVKN